MVESDKEYSAMVIGSGGRESAELHKLSQSPHVSQLYAWPGNDLAWINSEVPVQSFSNESPIAHRRIIEAVRDLGVSLVVVSPEDPINYGLVDKLKNVGITTFGPTQDEARLESNKHFSRNRQRKWGLPIPRFSNLVQGNKRDKYHAALDAWYADNDFSTQDPTVVKANGLALGKGVYVAESRDEAHFGLDYVMDLPNIMRSGIYFEEKVGGPNSAEWSSFFIVGQGPDDRHPSTIKNKIPWIGFLGNAQDHKRLEAGDKGLNTGGMGAINHPAFATMMYPRFTREVHPHIYNGLSDYKSSFILYPSWMYDFDTDKYWLIEFNTRWGDPEAEVLLPNINSDYFELLYSAARGQFKSSTVIGFDKSFYVSAAVVTKGYPEDSSANLHKPITGLIDVIADGNVIVYGAGAKQSGPAYLTNSGRNLHLVAEAESIAEARVILNKELSRLGGPIHFRRDIGAREDRYLDRHHAQIDDFVRQHRQSILT